MEASSDFFLILLYRYQDMSPSSKSAIETFFDGQGIFITGGTGFLGKVLIEKLLRSCQGIDRIYVLIRPSKTKNVESRLRDLINSQVTKQDVQALICFNWPTLIFTSKAFDTIRSSGLLAKILAVEGDLELPKLGLCAKDQETIIKNVSVVFHSAASINFDLPLKKAFELNFQGSRRVLELSKQILNLKVKMIFNTFKHFTRFNLYYFKLRF